MLKKLFFIIYSLFLIPTFSFAQKDIKRTWNWYFGSHAALNFSSGSPVVITTSQLSTLYGSASVSDSSGNLLFYTEGANIWNKNNMLMPNGSNIDPYGATDQHQILVLPKPDSSNIFYLFSSDYDSSSIHGQWEYIIINMTKNGGLGDIVSKATKSLKTNVLLPPKDPSLKITAIKNKNNHDYWIITMKLGTDSFYVYSFSDSGISAKPIISAIGQQDTYGDGNLIATSDGKKLAAGFNLAGIELLDFDNLTGVISNPTVFPSCNCENYGLVFSPDNQKLYSAVHYFGPPSQSGNAVYQYNLAAGNSAAIIASKTLLDSVWRIDSSGNSVVGFHLDLQLASDGKIYTTRNGFHSLGAIDSPDNIGTSCNFVDSALTLLSGFSEWGLPSFLSNYYYDSSLDGFQNLVLKKDNSVIYPNPNKGRFTIQASSTSSIGGEFNIVEIYNMLGEKIASSNSSEGGALNVISNVLPEKGKSWTVNLSNPSAGIYLYRVLNKEGNLLSTGKFIIQ